jgi:hypothetical protein
MGVNGYDIIGDIHGHADALEILLVKMGYRFIDGCYRHPDRVVIFLGDFIDRGPKQRQVLNTVMPMVKYGGSKAVMGNHEFNALAFHTLDPSAKEQWLRARTDKNISQRIAFLIEYLHSDKKEELDSVMDFFLSLPIWLELDGIRVVHACWDQNKIDALGSAYLTPPLLVKATTQGTVEYNAIETLLKGVEFALPHGNTFQDKDGHSRGEVRIKWWVGQDSKLCDIAMPPGVLDDTDFKDQIIKAENLLGYDKANKPVFIGHYWMSAKKAPCLLADNVTCLDYSVAKGGKLVAYRWSGEEKLSEENFVY